MRQIKQRNRIWSQCATVALLGGIFAGLAPDAYGAVFSNETLVHRTTTQVSVALNEETVLCSSADYSVPLLKVLIPELAAITLLDHQNFGAGFPCVAAGPCFDEQGELVVEPQAIINPHQPEESVAITVEAWRDDTVDDVAQTCDATLYERVYVQIRGLDFFHQRAAPLGPRSFSDCLAALGRSPQQTNETEDLQARETEEPADPQAIDPAVHGCQAAPLEPWLVLLAIPYALRPPRRRRLQVL